MSLGRLLPNVARARPSSSLRFAYRVLEESLPSTADRIVTEAVQAAGVEVTTARSGSWELCFPWRTMVYGFVRRDLEELARLRLGRRAPGWELELECMPLQTHSAHAAGAGGVLALAATVWLAAGWSSGVLPGLTTVLAGGLWVDVTRVMALGALEGRLRSLVATVGSALWPGLPAELHPPPPSFSPR